MQNNVYILMDTDRTFEGVFESPESIEHSLKNYKATKYNCTIIINGGDNKSINEALSTNNSCQVYVYWSTKFNKKDRGGFKGRAVKVPVYRNK